jgi:hypothetical protein
MTDIGQRGQERRRNFRQRASNTVALGSLY